MTAKKIINMINSLRYPFKGAKFSFKNKTVSIHDAEMLKIYLRAIKLVVLLK